jgi:hypothetical protein
VAENTKILDCLTIVNKNEMLYLVSGIATRLVNSTVERCFVSLNHIEIQTSPRRMVGMI